MLTIRSLLATGCVLGRLLSAGVTPPAQPAGGPGGSAYPYSQVIQSGPYFSVPGDTSSKAAYFLFQPAGGPVVPSLPVVLFLHGYLLNQEPATGDSPANYGAWIRHIVRKGYTVVFPLYDQGLPPAAFSQNIGAVWQASLEKLTTAGFTSPQEDAQGFLTAFVGHSLGAVEALTVAQNLAAAHLPVPRAIAAFTPGIGATGLPLDFHQIDSTTKLALVEGDEDTPADLATARTIWQSLVPVLPPANRDFLEVESDRHGTPAQLGNHWFPLTNGLNDTAPVDDRDYNGTWKLSVGLFDCAFFASNCTYVLTHGGTDEVNMGVWSDGVPVQPLVDMDPPPIEP